MKPADIKGPLQIVGLEVEGYKRIRVVRLTPQGHIVELTGRNRQGKTSLLDAIWSALKAADVTNDKPINADAVKATIKVNLGEIVVKRNFTAKGSSLIVEAKDGSAFGTPQRLLDDLIGNLSFDPLAFTRMKPADQYEQLRRIVPLEVDVDKLESLNAGDFARRTDLNRDAKAKRAQAEAVIVPANAPAAGVDEKQYLDKIENAAKHNADIERRKQNRASVLQHAEANEGQAARLRKQVEELKAEILALEKEATECDTEAKKARERLAGAVPLPDPIDVSAERAALEAAQAANAAYARLAQRQNLEAEAKALEDQASEITEGMEARTKTIHDAIAAAKMPIKGLAFGNGQITYNGQPFSQASGAETLMVSMAVGMAANPKVKVILIRDASLLDDQSRTIVSEMAQKHGYQVWMERVSGDKTIGVHIEDGEVVAIDGKAAKAAA
jgi:hypothetical protein